MIPIVFILILFVVLLSVVWMVFFKVFSTAPKEDLLSKIDDIFHSGDFIKAKEMLIKLGALKTKSVEIKLKFGLVLFNLGEYDLARSCFEFVLLEQPNKLDALLGLAKILQIQKYFNEALENYEKAIVVDNKNLECYLNSGKIYFEQKNYDKALEMFEKANEISPENSEVLFHITKCKDAMCDLFNESHCQDVISEYEKLIDSKDLPKEFDISLAKMYAKTGQVDNALEYAKKAIEKNQKDVDAYILLGLIQLIKKDYVAAKNSMSVALNIQQNNTEAHNIFSYILCHQVDNCPLDICREKYLELVQKFLR